MAGAVPQHRAGSNATTIGMVVAIVVAVLLLGVLIWLITQQETLRQNAEHARSIQERLASNADQDTARQLFPDANAPNKTLVGEMNAGVKLLLSRMTGNENSSPKTAIKEFEAKLSEIKDKIPDAADRVSSAYGAVTIIGNLFDMLQNAQKDGEDAKTALAKANEDLNAVRKANDDLNKTFKGDLNKLAARVEDMQKAKDEFERVKSAEIKSLADSIGEKQELLASARRDRVKLQEKARDEIEKRDKSIDEQSKALAEFRAPGTARAADPLAIAQQPVGKILRALPGDALVHINLGQLDNVVLGATFTVYSQNERVPADGHGKATIEVVGVGERTAECRIVTPPSPDNPIIQGDGVGNILLSRIRAKKVRVCVVGQFDTNFDGIPEPQGREAICALIKRYGAQLVDDVDASTDYLVVGTAPEGGPGGPAAPAAPSKEGAKKPAKKPGAKEPKEGDEEKPDVSKPEEGEEGEGAEEAGEGEGEGSDEGNKGDEEPSTEGDDSGGDNDMNEEPEAEAAPEEVKTPADLSKLVTRPGEIDPTKSPRLRREMSETQRYYEAIRRAEMFAVPRLRQDQLLSYVGIAVGADAMKRLIP
jgi:hypothetical protein